MDYEKLTNVIAIVFGSVTALLTVALAVAVSETWYLGLGIGLGVCGLFGGIIFLGIRQHRVRKIISKTNVEERVTFPASLEIPISESPYNLHSTFGLGKIAALTAIGIAVFDTFLFYRFELDYEMMKYIGLYSGGFFVICVLIAWTISSPFDKAEKLLKRTQHPRKFVMNESGLKIPIEIVTNNAFHRAVDQGITEIEIPWGDIVSWEIYGGAGRSPAQHSLKLQGSSQDCLAGFLPVLGIVRTQELKKFDHQIQGIAAKYLSSDVKIRTDEL